MQVVYLTNSRFPMGAAYSSRIRGLSLIFAQLGWSVHVICDYSTQLSGTFASGTFEALSLAPTTVNRIKATVSGTDRLKKYLITHSDVGLIVVGNLHDRFDQIMRLARQHGIAVVVEICEWYESSNWRGGRLNPYARSYKKCMANSYLTADGIIAISTKLAQRFDGHLPVCRIPTVLEPEAFINRAKLESDQCRLVQIGFPGKKKELFAPLITALGLLTTAVQSRLAVEIFGISESEFLARLQSTETLDRFLGSMLKIRGKIPQKEVPNTFSQADFSFFLREKSWQNEAGFPTKLAESMAAGTPVLTTNTGDVSLYLNPGFNGFFCSLDPVDIAHQLTEITELSSFDRQELAAHAAQTAQRSFQPDIYQSDMMELLRKIGLS